MIRYTVEWDPDAESQFTDRWVEADSRDREKWTNVANWIDAELCLDAESKGKPYERDSRILTMVRQIGLIKVAYTVSPSDRIVRVTRISIIEAD